MRKRERESEKEQRKEFFNLTIYSTYIYLIYCYRTSARKKSKKDVDPVGYSTTPPHKF